MTPSIPVMQAKLEKRRVWCALFLPARERYLQSPEASGPHGIVDLPDRLFSTRATPAAHPRGYLGETWRGC